MKHLISKEGFEKFKAEWEHLKYVERPAMINQVQAAAAEGDRSENAAYTYGRMRVREIDRRLRELDRILDGAQIVENAATKEGSRNRVEFAVKLPAEDDGFIYLPIDSKFPGDTYLALREAVEGGDRAQIEQCEKNLLATIRSEARDIHDKYIDPPRTTDFAILFLPFEGLYSEVVNRGMMEELQRTYKVNIAGPGTMAAMLNALQMGFRTLAVQKRSAEVWDVLRSVKKEFDTFADVLEKTQSRLEQANRELDSLVGVRTRQMQRQLAKVQTDEALD